MKHSKITLSILVTLLMLLSVACESVDPDQKGQDLFSQSAVLYKKDGVKKKEASQYDLTSVKFEKGDLTATHEFSFFANVIKKNDNDITILLTQNSTSVDMYNKANETQYIPFPSELVEFSDTLKIAAGEVDSDLGFVKLKYSDELNEKTKYLLALSMSGLSSGVGMMESAKVLYYSVEIAADGISKSVLLARDRYFKIDKDNSVISSDLGDFTMEGLIYVNKFRDAKDVGDAQISTIMGTEGATLLRFGDAGLDGNRLQANGVDVGVTFKTKVWYHIALVVGDGKTTVYINGEEKKSVSKSGYLGEFYIGKSWNDNRGIDAKLSEFRIWRTARTANEIKDNMYKAKDMTGIYAYWKMDSELGGKIPDVSGNGNDLVLFNQEAAAYKQQVIKFVDEEGISVGE